RDDRGLDARRLRTGVAATQGPVAGGDERDRRYLDPWRRHRPAQGGTIPCAATAAQHMGPRRLGRYGALAPAAAGTRTYLGNGYQDTPQRPCQLSRSRGAGTARHAALLQGGTLVGRAAGLCACGARDARRATPRRGRRSAGRIAAATAVDE